MPCARLSFPRQSMRARASGMPRDAHETLNDETRMEHGARNAKHFMSVVTFDHRRSVPKLVMPARNVVARAAVTTARMDPKFSACGISGKVRTYECRRPEAILVCLMELLSMPCR